MSDDIRRAIGKLVSVSADKFTVEMNRSTDNFTVIGFDDVHYIARLGSFVIIPVQSEYVVAEIVGLREKDNSSGSRYGSSSEIVDISSVKFLDLVPLGTLPQARDGAFRFGVSTYPSLYADALYTVDSDLDRIFEVTGESENAKCTDDPDATRLKAISIGKSVVFSDYAIKIRIDEFFGGHAAILGNTGSGKSCTVASIIQSLFSKPDLLFIAEQMLPLLDEKRVEMVARNQGIRAKEGESVAKLLTAFLRKAEEGAIGKLIVEAVILLSASKQADGGKVLRAAAQAYKLDTDAIALKVKQEFAAKAKSKVEKKPQVVAKPPQKRIA